MLIAHAPVGYIIAKKTNKDFCKNRSYVISSIVFAVWPDFDLIYYYFFDETKTFHHLYFTHLPIVAAVSFLIGLPVLFAKPLAKIKPYYILFYVNWTVHLILDTYTGGTAWLYPLNTEIYKLIKISANYASWVVSFMLHWSFLLELVIVLWAAIVFLRPRRNF